MPWERENEHDEHLSLDVRLLQQEYMIRSESFDDDMVMMNENNLNLFQRRGIIAAFDSLERAKKWVHTSDDENEHRSRSI